MPESRRNSFFHGTATKFSPGDTLLPALKTGQRVHSPDERYDEGGDSTRVFTTDDERDAWAFADSAAGGGKRPRVYEVRPEGNVGGNYQDMMPHTAWETTSDRAVVLADAGLAPPPGTRLFGEMEPVGKGGGTQPAFPGDDPNFAHGFMHPSEEMATDLRGRVAFDVGVGMSPERARASAGERERAMRRTKSHPELFDTDPYVNSDYAADKRFRSRW